jgi:hypothetical protein
VCVFGQDELKILLVHTLSKREKQILLKVNELEGRTFSAAVRMLRKDYPESTTKSVLRRFVAVGILNGGNGTPLACTAFGQTINRVMGSSSNGRILVSKTNGGRSNRSDPTINKNEVLI